MAKNIIGLLCLSPVLGLVLTSMAGATGSPKAVALTWLVFTILSALAMVGLYLLK